MVLMWAGPEKNIYLPVHIARKHILTRVFLKKITSNQVGEDCTKVEGSTNTGWIKNASGTCSPRWSQTSTWKQSELEQLNVMADLRHDI